MEKNKKGFASVLLSILTILMIVSLTVFVLQVSGGMANNITILVLSIICFLITTILLIELVSKHNKMVKMKNKIDESLSLIDIHLKLRFDLIPNLVNTVKGYAEHEKTVFDEITKLRNKAIKTEDENEKLDLANQMVPKMRQIVAISENYPKLKASYVFKNLMDELILIEDKLVASRRFYDSNVSMYNTTITIWPNSIIASLYGFEKQKLFKIDTGESINIKIN